MKIDLLCYYNRTKNGFVKEHKIPEVAKIIEQLSKDLRSAFPEMKGFSLRNLTYMRKFAEEYKDLEFVAASCCTITVGPLNQEIKSAHDIHFWLFKNLIKI